VAAGYAFNPIQNVTQSLTANNKEYWYIVLLTQATTLSGYQVFCNTSSADLLRVGVYRGALKTSASGNLALCGQCSGSPATTGGAYGGNISYVRRAFTVQSGQNLSFAAGEYITIAFHSQGSTNTFYASANYTAGNTQIAYQSTANYASTGFPLAPTSSHINSVLATKVCFELY
jgi:hypothetical protein